MTTLTPAKTSEAARMLVLRRVAKHHERFVYIATSRQRTSSSVELSPSPRTTLRKILYFPMGPFGETDPSTRSESSGQRVRGLRFQDRAAPRQSARADLFATLLFYLPAASAPLASR